MIFACGMGGMKQVRVCRFMGFARYSLRAGRGVMDMKEALGAVRWAHKRGFQTEMVFYGRA